MSRRIRRIVALVVVAAVAGLVLLVIVVRPGLRDDSEAVGTAWKPLLTPLDQRYGALKNVVGALQQAGAADFEVTHSLSTELSDWDLLRVTTDAESQARTANSLEGLAARVRAIVAGAKRLQANAPLVQAIAAFDKTVPPPPAVLKYNTVVVDYEHSRDGFWNRVVAGLDGYEVRPTLQLATAPAA